MNLYLQQYIVRHKFLNQKNTVFYHCCSTCFVQTAANRLLGLSCYVPVFTENAVLTVHTTTEKLVECEYRP